MKQIIIKTRLDSEIAGYGNGEPYTEVFYATNPCNLLLALEALRRIRAENIAAGSGETGETWLEVNGRKIFDYELDDVRYIIDAVGSQTVTVLESLRRFLERVAG